MKKSIILSLYLLISLPQLVHAFTMFNGWIQIASSVGTNWYSVDEVPSIVEGDSIRILTADVLTDPGYGVADACDEAFFVYRVDSGAWNEVSMIFDANVNTSDKWRLDGSIGPFAHQAEVEFFLRGRGDGLEYGDPASGSSWPLNASLGNSESPFRFNCGAMKDAEILSITHHPGSWGEQLVEDGSYEVEVQVTGVYHRPGVLQVTMQDQDSHVSQWIYVAGASSRNDTFKLTLPSSSMPEQILMTWAQFRPDAQMGPLISSMPGDVIEWGPDFYMFWRTPTGFHFWDSYVEIGNPSTSRWYGLSGAEHPHLPVEVELSDALILSLDVRTYPGYGNYNACDEAFLNYQVNNGVWHRRPLLFEENVEGADKWVLHESVGPFSAGDIIRLYLNGRGDGLSYTEGDSHGRWVIFDQDRSPAQPYTFRLQSGQKAEIHDVAYYSSLGWQAVAGRSFGVDVDVQATVPVAGLLQVTIFGGGGQMFQDWVHIGGPSSVNHRFSLALRNALSGVRTYTAYVQFRPGVVSGPLTDSGLTDTLYWAPTDFSVEWLAPQGFSLFDSYIRIGDAEFTDWYGLSGDYHPPMPAETFAAGEWFVHELDVKTTPGLADFNACDQVDLVYRVGGGAWRVATLDFETNVGNADKWRLTNPLGPFPQGATLRFYFQGYSDGLYYYEMIGHGPWIIQRSERTQSDPYVVRVVDGLAMEGATLTGVVTGRDSSGGDIGPLPGAVVSLSGEQLVSAGENGVYQFFGLEAGLYSVEASQSGYVSETQMVSVQEGGNQVLNLQLIQEEDNLPTVSQWDNLHGRHFLAGYESVVSFTGVIDWNGAPGTARVRAGDRWFSGVLTPEEEGRSHVQFDVTVPPVLRDTAVLRLEIVNGDGARRELSQNVFFYPFPELLEQFWPNPTLPVTLSATFKYDHHIPVPDLKVLKTSAKAGMSFGFLADPHRGQVKTDLKGSGKFGIKLDLPQAKVEGEARIGAGGSCTILFRGLQAPDIRPAWFLEFGGKAGASAPFVTIVSRLIPPAAPFVDTAMTIPVVDHVLGILKLGMYISLDGTVIGLYDQGLSGQHFLGTSGIDARVKAGLEGRAFAELLGAEAGAYLRGEGSVNIELVPELGVTEIALDAYLGVYVDSWVFQTHEEFVFPLYLNEFDSQPGVLEFQQHLETMTDSAAELEWYPLGSRSRQDLPIASPMSTFAETGETPEADPEGMVVSRDVFSVASPVLRRQGDAQLLFYVHFDEELPLHASTRLVQARRESDVETWTLASMTQGGQGEFQPDYLNHPLGDSFAVWVAYTGEEFDDLNPQVIESDLEIFAAFRDDVSGAWGPAFQVSQGDGNNMQPRAILMDGQPAVIWLHNEFTDTGDSDVVRTVVWDGNEWNGHAEVFRSDAAIVRYACLVDDVGDTHILLVLDADRLPWTLEDRQMIYLHTDQGVWQSPLILTDQVDSVSDAVLVVLEDEVHAVWVQNGMIFGSSVVAWLPTPLHDAELSPMQAAAMAITATDQGAALVYVDLAEGGADLMGMLYDTSHGAWGSPVRITDDSYQPNAPTIIWDSEQQKLSIGYIQTTIEMMERVIMVDGNLVTITNAPVPGRRDLVVLDYLMGVDLAIVPESLVTDPAPVAPGSVVQVQFVYVNRGEQSAAARVRLHYGDLAAGGELLYEATMEGADWIPGQLYTAVVEWVVSSNAVADTLYASIQPVDDLVTDRDLENNTIAIEPMRSYVRFAQLEHQVLDDNSLALVFEFSNDGTVASEETYVEVRLDGPAGDILQMFMVPTIPAGGLSRHVFIWDSLLDALESQEANLVVMLDTDPEVGEALDVPVQALNWAPATTDSGISKAWLRQYGLPEDGSVDHMDLDGDGMTVLQEWIAGTQPTNRFSVLAIDAVPNAEGGGRLYWDPVPDRIYHIERATNLHAGTVFETIEVRGGSEGGYVDLESFGGGRHYFRIRVE